MDFDRRSLLYSIWLAAIFIASSDSCVKELNGPTENTGFTESLSPAASSVFDRWLLKFWWDRDRELPLFTLLLINLQLIYFSFYSKYIQNFYLLLVATVLSYVRIDWVKHWQIRSVTADRSRQILNTFSRVLSNFCFERKKQEIKQVEVEFRSKGVFTHKRMILYRL